MTKRLPPYARVPASVRNAVARTAADVRRYGWQIQYVGGDRCQARSCRCGGGGGPPFAYTVGLFGLGHPELLVFDLAPPAALTVLNTLGERVRSGRVVEPGKLIHVDHPERARPGVPHHLMPEEVPNPGDIVLAANRFYRRKRLDSVPVIQLSQPDDEHRFPWEEGFAAPERQPRPGTFRA